MTILPDQPTRHALVLGATGALGRTLAHGLRARGWSVTGLSRNRAGQADDDGIAWLRGDALSAPTVAAAAAGADLIVHAVNPPGYEDWRGLAIPMLANTIAAARASGATILFPGNVYNFDPDDGGPFDEEAPQHPVSRKGRVRVDMEAMLEAAARDGVRSIVVRAGDFFGPGAEGAWFGQAVAKGGAAAARLTYPGDPAIGHAWAYLPDLAQAMLRLVDRRASLAPFEIVHFGGHWVEPGIAIAHAARDVLGRPDLPIRPMPWWPVFVGAPFVTFLRELIEMRYLWRKPLRLANGKLERLIGPEPHTPLHSAVAASLGLPSAPCPAL